MKPAYIAAPRPADVAREVEALLEVGCRKFILRRVANGEMLDRERLGAARYVAGLHAEVELEGEAGPGASIVSMAGAAAR